MKRSCLESVAIFLLGMRCSTVSRYEKEEHLVVPSQLSDFVTQGMALVTVYLWSFVW